MITEKDQDNNPSSCPHEQPAICLLIVFIKMVYHIEDEVKNEGIRKVILTLIGKMLDMMQEIVTKAL